MRSSNIFRCSLNTYVASGQFMWPAVAAPAVEVLCYRCEWTVCGVLIVWRYLVLFSSTARYA